MNPLDFLDKDQLQVFFRRNKTEMSCMDKPHTFINHLRDYNFILEERYRKVIRIKSTDKMKTSVYELLDWIEKERPWNIKPFWTCVFKDIMMTQYPTLKRLRDSLFDGSFQFFDGEDSSEHAREGLSEDEFLEKKRGGRGKRGSFCDRGDQQGHSSSQPTPRKKKLMTPTFEDEDSGEHARGGLSEDEFLEKKRGGRGKRGSFCDRDDQQGHSSSQESPRKKKLMKPTFGSLPKGENAEIWKWEFYRHQLPVTCGRQQGTLSRTKLAKGEPCILRSKKWYTPCEFEKLNGKLRYKNWKKSIHCMDTTLEKLLKQGHLKCPGYNKSKAKRSTLPCSSNTVSAISDTEEELEEEEEGGEEELQANPDEDEVSQEDEEEVQGKDCCTQRSNTDQGDNPEQVTDEGPRVGHKVFRVTCGALTGMLHERHFASGRCGKSIRTEDRWLSPVEFVEQGSAAPNALWRRDIQWEGQPLSSLIEEMLILHSEQCFCQLCQPDPQALEGQKNDDECFVCRSEGDLVMCDHCPRSFHPECHLPRVDPSTLQDNSAWMCTFCIWKMTEYRSQMTQEETLMRPVSHHMLQCHYLLLTLYNADKDHIFVQDPCIHVRGYRSQIETPMWLNKITEQLLDQQYTIGELLTDIQLIFSNCDQFNQNNPEFRDMGVKLKEFYEQEVEKVFRSQWQRIAENPD